MHVFTLSSLRRTPEEELRTAALPPVHPGLPDVLHRILGARMGVAEDVVGVDAWGMVLCGTDCGSWNCDGTVMTYNGRSHVTPPMCHSVRLYRLLLAVGRAVLHLGLLQRLINEAPNQFRNLQPGALRYLLERHDLGFGKEH
jgi:hypothetical protein